MDDCKVCVVGQDSDTHTDRDSIPEAWLNLRRWDLPAHTCDTPARGVDNGLGGLQEKYRKIVTCAAREIYVKAFESIQ